MGSYFLRLLQTGGSSFNPGSLAPSAWYKYGYGITEAGTGVSVWADYSGNGNDLLQGTDARRPTKNVDGSITFNGTSDSLRTGALSIATPWTGYILLNKTSWTSASAICDGASINQAGLIDLTATPTIACAATGTGASNSDLVLGSYAVVAYGTKVASTSCFTQVNNNAEATGGNVYVSAITSLILGSSSETSRWTAMTVKEWIVFPAIHTSSERAEMIAYMMSVGGL